MAYRTASYRRRVALSVVTTATASTADIEFTPSDAWDEFWDAIDTDGYGIRLTEADGVTALSYAWSGFNKTNKTGTIQIDAAPTPVTADKCVLYWLYYDADSPTDGSSAVTISGPLTAYLDRTRPDPVRTFDAAPQVPGATAPAQRLAKSTDDSFFIWIEYTGVLQRLAKAYNGRLQWEEPAVGQFDVLDSDGNAVSAMTTAADMRWVSVRDGQIERIYLRARVNAGSDGAEYTASATVLTDSPDESPYRTMTHGVALTVRDLLASGALSVAPLGTSGWASYTDSTHTSGSPQALTASTRAEWSNDGATSVERYSPLGGTLWASNRVDPTAVGELYILRIDFTINPSTTNSRTTIDIDQGSAPFSGTSDIVLTKQIATLAATASAVSLTIPVAVTSSMVANDIAVGITCSVNANVYAKKITITRVH